MGHKNKDCGGKCYYKLVEHRLPAFPDGGNATLNYFGGQPDDPNTPGFSPKPEVGPFLNPHTDDKKVSACIWSLNGQPLRGSTTSGDPTNPNDTNYFMSFLSGSDIPSSEVSIQFKSHGCAVPVRFYIVGTDVDGGESYNAASLLAQGWAEAPENQVANDGSGLYAGNANDSETFALVWDVLANGMPPIGTLSGETTTGQSVLILLADYYCPIKTKGCGANLKAYDCNGEYEGELFLAEDIGAECCGDCPEPVFFQAPRSCSTLTTPGVNEEIWTSANIGGNAAPHGNLVDIFNGVADPNNGLPSHINGAPDLVSVVADWNDNDIEGGNNPADQTRWWGWINIPQDGVPIQEVNGNTGERIRVWSGAVCTPPQVIKDITTNTSNPRGAGDLGTFNCGWVFMAVEISDLTAFGGVQLQWDLGAGMVNIPASATSSTQPVTDGECIKKPVPTAVIPPVDAGLSEAEIIDLVGPHAEPATTVPIPDNEVDTDIRTGQVGTSVLYARADHNHPIRRQANPGDPVITVSGGTLNQSIILDRFSDEESYSYRFRVLVSQTAGTGWAFITIPTKAGFQQPMFSEVNGYRSQSIAPQNDDTGNGNGFGASPRGPYMGENPTHWSSTNRLYLPHFRRDNAFVTYVGFVVTYVRS